MIKVCVNDKSIIFRNVSNEANISANYILDLYNFWITLITIKNFYEYI